MAHHLVLDNVSCLQFKSHELSRHTVNSVAASGFFCHSHHKRSASNKLQYDIQCTINGVKILCTDSIRKSDNTFNKQPVNRIVVVVASGISYACIRIERGHLNLNTQCIVCNCVVLCCELDWIRKMRQCAFWGTILYTLEYSLTYFMRPRSSEKNRWSNVADERWQTRID